MYRLINNSITNRPDSVMKTNGDGTMTSIPFDPANTDYQQFKADVLAGAELQDADGNVMSQEAVTAFISEFP